MTEKIKTEDARAGQSDGHLMKILLVSLVLAAIAWFGVSFYEITPDPSNTSTAPVQN